ncbi:MAG: GGDEF domain-containing protein [Proteobacteria bacterium]|nr:GGDEF domain-containing protein [Pseudomonadota bacterium]
MNKDFLRFLRRPISLANLLWNTRTKALNRHILSIHSQGTIEDLVSETSKILKVILNYKLFAFVLSGDDGLHIWSDPLLSKSSLLAIVGKDFPSADIGTLRYISKNESNIISTFFHKPESVLSYDFSNATQKAKLYLIHKHHTTPSEKETYSILISSFKNTLNTILKINDLEKTVTTDPLTGCYNRRALNDLLDRTINNAQRYKRDVSLIMMDIDFFKSINDTHGHLFGDKVLQAISHEIHGFIRKGDFLARYGGEEFVVVLPETSLSVAVEITHRLKWKIENLRLQTPTKGDLKVTASYGVSSLNQGDNSQSLLSEADAMLYRSKENGRNCVMPFFDKLPIKTNSCM